MGLLVPDLMCESVYDIPKTYFSDNGIKSIFLDIDNTLVSYNDKHPTESNREWLTELAESGIKVVLVSNNSKERVETFAEGLGVDYIYDARKPLTKAYKSLITRHKLDKKHIAVVGDQIFTDVLAGKLIGALTVVVEPIEKVENAFFRLKRVGEVPFVAYYRFKHRNDGKNKGKDGDKNE